MLYKYGASVGYDLRRRRQLNPRIDAQHGNVRLALSQQPLGGGAAGLGSRQAPAADAQTVATDRAALVAFYNATSGGSWNNNSRWLSDDPLGSVAFCGVVAVLSLPPVP